MNKDLKGYKVQIVGLNTQERYVGLVSELDDEWITLVPFAVDALKEKYKEINPDMDIIVIHSTVIKRIDTISTFIILDKPDETYEQDNTEDTED